MIGEAAEEYYRERKKTGVQTCTVRSMCLLLAVRAHRQITDIVDVDGNTAVRPC